MLYKIICHSVYAACCGQQIGHLWHEDYTPETYDKSGINISMRKYWLGYFPLLDNNLWLTTQSDQCYQNLRRKLLTLYLKEITVYSPSYYIKYTWSESQINMLQRIYFYYGATDQSTMVQLSFITLTVSLLIPHISKKKWQNFENLYTSTWIHSQ